MPRSRNIEDFEKEFIVTLNEVQTNVGDDYNKLEKRVAKWYEIVNNAMAQAEKGIKVPIPNFKDFCLTDDNISNDNDNVNHATMDETTPQLETNNIGGRSKRSAALKALKPISSQRTLKQERLSNCVEEDEQHTEIENIEPPSIDLNAVVKEEKCDDMPPPTRAAPKARRGRPQSTKVKQEKIDEELSKRSSRSQSKNLSSNVILKEQTLVTIVLSDSDSEETVIDNTEPINQNCASSSSKKEADTYYDDAVISSTQEANNADAPSALNITVVLEKPTVLKEVQNNMLEADPMTDCESFNCAQPSTSSQIPKPTPHNTIGKAKTTKQVVSASEQLQNEEADASATTIRVTRNKLKAMANEENSDAGVKQQMEQKTVKDKIKMFTPASSKLLPLASSTANKKGTKNTNTSSVTNKSTLNKGPQSEYKELKRQEEAVRKREALLQAKIEETKRIREEKHVKAMANRELMEKEKMLREAEQARKKKLMPKSADEEKKRTEEETRRLEADKAHFKAKRLHKVIYRSTPAPKLPTNYDYDTDDEDNQLKHFHLADWAQPKQLERQQKLQLMLGEKIKNSFFSIQAQTTDLAEIFEVIEPAKLKRSSSACWSRPPRFTMIPNQLLESFQEESDEE